MIKEIVVILLLFNGEMLLKPHDLILGNSIHSHLGGTVMECLDYGDQLRVKLSTHKWVDEDIMKSGWYLNDGSGNWQGYICQ